MIDFIIGLIIILRINNIIFVQMFIIYLLILIRYTTIPNAIPKNIYPRISPLLTIKILNKRINADINKNIISCIYVIISDVLKHFLKILNKSNIIPIIPPISIKNKNLTISLDIKFFYSPFPYLNNLFKNPP